MEACTFLKQKYPNLHLSPEVQAARRRTEKRTGKRLSDRPEELIRNYLDRLGEISKLLPEAGISKKFSVVQRVLEKLLVRPGNIPAKAFESDLKLAEQYGRGRLKKTPEYIVAKSRNFIRDQKKSLVDWIDFLFSSNLTQPLWVKYWVFRSLSGMGAYDPRLGVFNERTESTYEAFPSLDKDAVAKIMEAVVLRDQIKRASPDFPSHGHCVGALKNLLNGDAEFERLLEGCHFAKMYARLLGHNQCWISQAPANIEGEWVKYPQDSDPEILVKAIHGFPLEWCTRNHAVAGNHLAMGDFWVYFTTRHDNDLRYPRLAIRMNGSDRVEEARGTEKNQIVDAHAMPVLEAKLKEFGENGDSFAKKYRHVRTLTAITEKHRSGQSLSAEDLRFLYEVDETIDTYLDVIDHLWDEVLCCDDDDEDGWTPPPSDPRINEILAGRDRRQDLAEVFACRPEQIALYPGEALLEGVKYYNGDLVLGNRFSPVGLHLPERIGGKLELPGLKTLDGLQLPKFVGKDLTINAVVSLEEVVFPEHVGGNLILKKLVCAQNIQMPRYVGGNIRMPLLQRYGKKLDLPATVGGDIDLNSLPAAEGLRFPDQLFDDIYLGHLKTARGLQLPAKLHGVLNLDKLSDTKGLSLPRDLKGRLYLNGLKNGKGLRLPKRFSGTLYLNGIVSAKELVLPRKIDGSLHLSGLQSASDLVLPRSITGLLCLSGLTSAKGLELPQKMTGKLDLSGLTSAKHLKFPRKVSCAIRLGGLTDAKGLVLPRIVRSSLELGGLTSAKGLKLPQTITGCLNLDGLTELENFRFTTKVNRTISLNGLVMAKNVQFPTESTGSLHLERLVQAENIVFPKVVRGDLCLENLLKIQNSTWPQKVRSDLRLDSMIELEGFQMPTDIGGALYFGPHSDYKGKPGDDDFDLPF